MSLLLYLLLIACWGFSWIAIKWQQGDVATEVSIFYRFAMAAVAMFLLGKILGWLQPVRLSQHKWFALQGCCLFSFNFLFFYHSTFYIASGLTAVTMATAPIFNAVLGRYFYGTEIKVNFILGAPLGLMGIGLLFAGDFMALGWSWPLLKGMLLALAGTCCFSLGNMLSIRNSKQQVQPYTATSYAMLYGCAVLLLIILFGGHSFQLELAPRYVWSLLYLALPASVFGFTAYLLLVDRLGAHNAAYILVITPCVALLVSSVYENYQWGWHSSIGLALVIAGNLVIQQKSNILSPSVWLRRKMLQD